MSRKIVNVMQDGEFVIFELEDGSLEEKEIFLTRTEINNMLGADFDVIFGTYKKNDPESAKKMIEVDAEVFANMQKAINDMSKWQADQQHNQLENSRLTDVLNRRRSGEDSAPTKADLMESEREQTRTIVYEERKLIFKEKTDREKKEFIKNEGNKIRESFEKYGNMTGSPMKARPGEGQEEFNNRVFGGGRR